MVAWKTDSNPADVRAILIVSQDAEMVSVWEALFEQKHCRVFVETAPTDAVQSSRVLSPALIVLELDLPHSRLIALCRELRATTSGTLLLLAPRGGESEISKYHTAGVDEYIATPISPMALLIKSMAWLARQEWALPRGQTTPMKVQ
jgi:DNA-binding response OmpR family regulator